MGPLGMLIEELRSFVGPLDADGLSGDEAMALCAQFAEVERLGAAGRLVVSARVAATEEWRRGGCRSAAEWVAHRTGVDPERARDGLQTASRLASCPLVAAALRAGQLSDAQASVIVDALATRPELERHLLEFAAQHSLRRLREECRQVKNAAASAEKQLAEVHRNRCLKTWTGRDGSFRFSGSATAPGGAEFLARVEERKAQLAKEGSAEGRQEALEALALDALMQLVTEERRVDANSGSARRARSWPKTMILVHVAYEALVRGSVEDGEVCEIKGIGPIPVEAVRRLGTDAILRVLVTKGAQPMAVTPGKRTIPRALRLLIEARDRHCAIKGCDVQWSEIDHNLDFSLLGPTDLENCAGLCRTHHGLKTYLGFRRVRDEDGDWILVPPDDYLDPEPPDPAVGPTVWRNPWTGRIDGDRSADEYVDQLVLAGAAGPAP